MRISHVLLSQFSSAMCEAVRKRANELGQDVPEDLERNQSETTEYILRRIPGLAPDFIKD